MALVAAALLQDFVIGSGDNREEATASKGHTSIVETTGALDLSHAELPSFNRVVQSVGDLFEEAGMTLNHLWKVNQASFLISGSFAVGAGGAIFRLWDTQNEETPRVVAEIKTEEAGVATLSPDGRQLACTAGDSIGIYEIRGSGSDARFFCTQSYIAQGEVEKLRLSPDGGELVVQLKGGGVQRHELRNVENHEKLYVTAA